MCQRSREGRTHSIPDGRKEGGSLEGSRREGEMEVGREGEAEVGREGEVQVVRQGESDQREGGRGFIFDIIHLNIV